MMSNAAKSFDILGISLSVLHNHFNNPTKLFSNLYLAKFLDTSAKSFFPCMSYYHFLQNFKTSSP